MDEQSQYQAAFMQAAQDATSKSSVGGGFLKGAESLLGMLGSHPFKTENKVTVEPSSNLITMVILAVVGWLAIKNL